METSVQTKKPPARDVPQLTFGGPLPELVGEFCAAHDLVVAVNQSMALVRKYFGVEPSSLYLGRDPDTAEEWVTVSVTTAKPVEEACDVYMQYIGDWVRTVTDPSARAKVCLAYFVE